MHIVALKSPDSRDHRSVLHPDTVGKITALKGASISFESGIGDGINVSDQTFNDLGLKAISRDECLSNGLITVRTGRETIKLGPPLTITKDGMLDLFRVGACSTIVRAQVRCIGCLTL